MLSRSSDEIAKAREQLKKLVKPGDTLYTILRHTSTRGTSRHYSVYCIEDNKPVWITGYVRTVCQYTDYKRFPDVIVVAGGGFSGSNEIVMTLGRALFDRGHKIKGWFPKNNFEGGLVPPQYCLRVEEL
jgi:hypothetical protein